MTNIIMKMKHTFTQLNLESRILIISMLTGTLICFASAVGNFFPWFGSGCNTNSILNGRIIYLFFLHNILKKNNYAFAAYGSLLMLTCLVFSITLACSRRLVRFNSLFLCFYDIFNSSCSK